MPSKIRVRHWSVYTKSLTDKEWKEGRALYKEALKARSDARMAGVPESQINPCPQKPTRWEATIQNIESKRAAFGSGGSERVAIQRAAELMVNYEKRACES